MYQTALRYLQELNWAVIPIGRDKKPLISWLPYQQRLPTPEEVGAWWSKYPQANIGVITGAISGLVVMDCDGPEGQEAYIAEFGGLHETIRQHTGRKGGIHLLFKHPGNGSRYSNMARVITKVDVRGDGGYIVVAPSLHSSGRRYAWDNINPLDDGLDDLLLIPPEITSVLKDSKTKKSKSTENQEGWVQELLMGVDEGQRNDAAAKLAGFYLNRFNGDVDVTLSSLDAWNTRNRPPLEFSELRTVINSIASKHGREQLSETVGGAQFNKLVKLIYPDGSVRWNVWVDGCETYVQLTSQELGTFGKFKFRMLDLANYLPDPIKQGEWEKIINKAVEEAEIIRVPEDETKIGIVLNTIQAVIRNQATEVSSKYADQRILLIGDEGNQKVALKISVLMNYVATRAEKITRNEVADALRRLGFVSTTCSVQGTKIRMYQCSLRQIMAVGGTDD